MNLFQAPLASDRDSRYLQELQAGIAKVDLLIPARRALTRA